MKDPISNMEKLQSKVAGAVLIASAILIFLIILDDLYLQLYLIASIKVPVILIFGWAYRILQRKGFQEKYTHFVNIPMLVFFVINYLGNQGSDGPTFYGVLTLFVTYPILLSKKWRWFYIFLTLVVVTGLLFYGSDKNNLIVAEYESPIDQFQDHLFTFVAVSIFLSMVVTIVLDFYKMLNLQLMGSRQQLQEQLEFANSEKQKNETLLRVLAHDVRSPVNNLGQMIELYEAEDLSKQDFKRIVDTMKNRIQDLRVTIDNILSDVKKKSESSHIDSEPISPIFFTQAILDGMQYKWQTKQQILNFQYEQVKPQISLSKYNGEINIILKNLLDNAHKYSDVASIISVRIKESQEGVEWTIDSPGEPIPAEIQSVLFERALDSRNGSGVGLFLCKSLADRIGGILTYSSLPSINRFTFTIR
ncbi:hypothetical protein LPTSP4_16480 [Leptospira ryugenii]|uniref:histidine kinase n=1 Tax=Leptospira ryugenii TaxID=1917863 RepID=A0A2P2DZR0_9LEPT|nr:HAMP domain-containing sensor histidine kinase [Leptospira ryugenii]GBF50124.1 hypothetical protein LPTSP4_16480 [Leptospira ryugenii]